MAKRAKPKRAKRSAKPATKPPRKSRKLPGLDHYRQIKAKLAEIELARLQGEVVSTAGVQAMVERFCETIRVESAAMVEQIETAAGLTGGLAKLAADARLAFLRRCAAVMEKWQRDVKAKAGAS